MVEEQDFDNVKLTLHQKTERLRVIEHSIDGRTVSYVEPLCAGYSSSQLHARCSSDQPVESMTTFVARYCDSLELREDVDPSNSKPIVTLWIDNQDGRNIQIRLVGVTLNRLADALYAEQMSNAYLQGKTIKSEVVQEI